MGELGEGWGGCTVKGGWRDDGGREKGKRHAIICRSLTSPVNPQSCLTLLIKEAIKGPPPELFEGKKSGRGRKRETGQKQEEKCLLGRVREGKEKGYGCYNLCYCFICQPPPLRWTPG